MAEFQWWLLLVGLVAGGGLVAIVTMDGRRREEDLEDVERQAEATWIARRLYGQERGADARTVGAILRIHREYLSLPPPDRLTVEGGDEPAEARPDLADRDADRDPDDIGDDRGSRPDEDLPPA